MTKKELKKVVNQLWYELNNVNYYVWKAQETDCDRHEVFDRLMRREAAVDTLKDLCNYLEITITISTFEGCNNVIYGSYKGEAFVIWCIEYRDDIRDAAFKHYQDEVDRLRPMYYGSDFIFNPDFDTRYQVERG